MGILSTTCKAMAGGIVAIEGTARDYRLQPIDDWVLDEHFTLILSEPQSGRAFNVGYGSISGAFPSYLMTYKRKMYTLAGTNMYFSALEQPTIFNDPTADGNGYIQMANNFALPEDLMAIAPYQGRIAVFGKNSTQVWSTSADPATYQQEQVLNNVGTFASLSVQALGELDVYFLDETGVRSLRVRDQSLNAYVVDIGSPVDLAIQAKLATCTDEEKHACCGIVDPTSNRYWLFIKDTIYVLSSFPSAKVTAWSTFKPSYQSADEFFIHNQYAETITVKLANVNNVNAAFQTLTIAPAATVTYTPAGFIWVYVNGELRNYMDIPGGLDFFGKITFGGDGWRIQFQDTQVPLVPEKFFVHESQIYARTVGALAIYGGLTGQEYDNCVVNVQLPWLDAESSEKAKSGDGIIASMSGAWYGYASMDYLGAQWTNVFGPNSVALYDGGIIPFSSMGTHFNFRLQTNAASAAKLSALTFKFK